MSVLQGREQGSQNPNVPLHGHLQADRCTAMIKIKIKN